MKNLTQYINESSKNVYYIWQENGIWKGTDEENHDKRVRDANKILDFNGFDSFDEVKEYINTYFSKDLEVKKGKA